MSINKVKNTKICYILSIFIISIMRNGLGLRTYIILLSEKLNSKENSTYLYYIDLISDAIHSCKYHCP